MKEANTAERVRDEKKAQHLEGEKKVGARKEKNKNKQNEKKEEREIG